MVNAVNDGIYPYLNLEKRRKFHFKRLSKEAAGAFCVCLLFGLIVAGIFLEHRCKLERAEMECLIIEKSIAIQETVSRLLYKTQGLAALVIDTRGHVANFERVAASLVDDPDILNVLLAPDGVVADVYPRAGNEALLGYDLFGQGPGNKEAVLAKERGSMVFGGPFPLLQGGWGLVGRLPVRVEDSEGIYRFWGLVSVTLRFPQVMDGLGLNTLERLGYAYEIRRFNPDTEEKQIIASGGASSDRGDLVEKRIRILNSDWLFRLAPLQHHFLRPEKLLMLGLVVSLSLLIGLIVQRNADLRAARDGLERMVKTDPLTGLLNRKGLFPILENLLRRRETFHLWYIDLNHFKQVNDTFGHNVGDVVLREFGARLSRLLGSEHIFARIGGDEFVLLHLGGPAGPEDTAAFWAEAERQVGEEPIMANGRSIFLTFSKGVAACPEDGETPDALIACADRRMYDKKNERLAAERKRRAGDRADNRF